MRVITAEDVDRLLNFPALIEALRRGFMGGIDVPLRHHHTLPDRQGGQGRMLLLMPAWSKSAGAGYLGTKLVTVFPDNPAAQRPTVQGSYILFSAQTGAPLAAIDGTRLTLWRTAAASALAASYLARRDASHLVMMGAGAMAPFLIRAHAAVRPIERVTICNRTPANAELLAEELNSEAYKIDVTDDARAAVSGADIISCATVSTVPLVRGDWVKPGTHVDLVGAFRADMRESDDALIARARLFADTSAGAFGEAGDILLPLKAGVIGKDHLLADLFDLAQGRHQGRCGDDEVTVFKSVGTALEDLAGAVAVYEALSATSGQ